MSDRKITVKSGNEEFTLEVTEEEYRNYYRSWWQQKKHEQSNREAMEQNGYTEESYEAWRDKNLVINEAQAAIVRRVFDEFMNGLNPEVIAAELNSEGVPGCMGEPKWAVSTIQHILENEKYKGDVLLQKYYTSDFHSKNQ